MNYQIISVLLFRVVLAPAEADQINMFSSPSSYWKSCKDTATKDPHFSKCFPKDMTIQLKNMCEKSSNKRDCPRLPDLFNAKSYQSEAKTGLSMIFINEKSKFLENGSYDVSDEALKQSINPKENHRYMFGFLKSCVSPSKSYMTTFLGDAAQAHLNEIKNALSKISQSQTCTNPKIGFIAIAVGWIYPNGKPDVWTINENKELKHIEDGILADPFK